MDVIDRKLLNLLQVNADLPLSEIAKKVGISSTPCWNRIKRLEEKGIIKYKISLVDKEKVGYAVTVFLSISVSNHNSDWFTEFEKVVMRHRSNFRSASTNRIKRGLPVKNYCKKY